MDARRVAPAERGIAEMRVDLCRGHASPLTQDMLFAWHRLLLQGRTNLQVGQWRSGSEPMQVVSGPIHAPKVHFEAPPAEKALAQGTGQPSLVALSLTTLLLNGGPLRIPSGPES